MIKRTLSAAALSALIVTSAFAQDATPEAAAPSPDTVLATVNGETITFGDVTYARAALGEAVQQVPEGQRDEMVLSLLIDMMLMAGAAEDQGVADTPEFQQRMAFQRKQALQEAYMTEVMQSQITPEALQARYDEEVAKLPKEQLTASHILVETEDEAKDIIKELEEGADFAELAKEHSKDPGSAERGGSLGEFTRGRMVKPFEDAAFALDVGEITEEPVQSQFGWHVIRLDDRGEMPVPPLSQVAGQIQQLLVRDAYVSAVAELKEDATIETADGEMPASPAGQAAPLPTPAQ